MSALQESPLLPLDTPARLKQELTRILRDHAVKVNQMAAGSFAGFDKYSTTVPTTGTWLQGDYVKKSNPVEAGGAGAKYVIIGWQRITSGSGNVLNTDWVELRALTGN